MKKKIIIVLVILIVAAGAAFGSSLIVKDHSDNKKNGATEKYENASKDRELKMLLNKYYKAYAEGDIKSLKKVATPFSEREESYIKFMSAYVDAYVINEIYTKPGEANGELMVSAYVSVKYKGVYSKAPSLDFFYVRLNKSDELYIDNRYSLFNQQNGDMDVDEGVAEMINTFELQEDVTKLKTKVQKEYDRLLKEDAEFNEFFTKTLPEVIKNWARENQ